VHQEDAAQTISVIECKQGGTQSSHSHSGPRLIAGPLPQPPNA